MCALVCVCVHAHPRPHQRQWAAALTCGVSPFDPFQITLPPLLPITGRKPATVRLPGSLAQAMPSLPSFPPSLSAYFVLFLSVLLNFPFFISPFSPFSISVVFCL